MSRVKFLQQIELKYKPKEYEIYEVSCDFHESLKTIIFNEGL